MLKRESLPACLSKTLNSFQILFLKRCSQQVHQNSQPICAMAAMRQRINAKLINTGDRAVLLLDDKAQPVYLCYALIVRESEVEIYPESLLDDWGHEINSLYLYEWIQENGLQFPRAEIFGFDSKGKRKQYFLRELDLMARYPCYVFESNQTPITGGVLIEAILIPKQHIIQPKRIKRPHEVVGPLHDARASWWQVPADNLEGVDMQLFAPTHD